MVPSPMDLETLKSVRFGNRSDVTKFLDRVDEAKEKTNLMTKNSLQRSENFRKTQTLFEDVLMNKQNAHLEDR